MMALVIHGGAWDIPEEETDSLLVGLRQALTAGWDYLAGAGTAIDAVTAAIQVMEDDEAFNAGRGAVINAAGMVELDASIMNGTTLGAGAVAGVRVIKNPILLARLIMDENEHVLLMGEGALRFAHEHKAPICPPSYFITSRELERQRKTQGGQRFTAGAASQKKRLPADTVGAVALDSFGTIAAGTSTGGIPNKYPGRVGDAPLIGCGTYALSTVGGVSTTGMGEAMIKVVMAKTVVDLIKQYNGNAMKAVREGMEILVRQTRGYGGVIALSRQGEIGIAYNTSRMARGYMTTAHQIPFVAL